MSGRNARLSTALAAIFTVQLLGGRAVARADDEPIFDGPRALTRHTKEVGVEMTSSATDVGPTAGGGASIAAFYSRWFASFAGATYSPRLTSPRERWEARGGGRLVYPEPLHGGLFVYLVGGGSLLMTAVDGLDATFHRALTGVFGVGVFGNVAERARLRIEMREHVRLFGVSDTRHALTVGLSVVVLYR